MLEASRLPVLVAAGQAIEREEIVGPVDLAERACQAAFLEAPMLRDRIHRLSVVNILSGSGSAPASALARRLGLGAPSTEVSTVGGNSPQWLVNRAAQAIATGELDAVLIAGAEAQRSRRVMRSQGSIAAKPAITEEEATDGDPMVGDTRPGASAAEMSAGLLAPVHFYAMFESAIAHRLGRSNQEQRDALGGLMAPFTEVAAKHPYAWFPEERSASEIALVEPDNRLVAEPYPKRMCAFMQVDQAAAVIVCSLDTARAAGVEENAVFCWSGADVNDVWYPVARPDPGRSPGMAAAFSAALEASTLSVDDLDAIDLYSCFPCVVEMAIEALGIAGSPRVLTVTGGLPYFGGPGNDYTLHAIATMARRLRDEGGKGLVSGLGWYATKHSAGVYGDSPPGRGWMLADTGELQARIDGSELEIVGLEELEQAVQAAGPVTARVVAGTVAMDRSGTPTAAPVIASLPDGRRVAVAAREDSLEDLLGRNLVGSEVRMSGSPPRYVPVG